MLRFKMQNFHTPNVHVPYKVFDISLDSVPEKVFSLDSRGEARNRTDLNGRGVDGDPTWTMMKMNLRPLITDSSDDELCSLVDGDV